MACSKLVLLLVGLHALAFLIAISEAHPVSALDSTAIEAAVKEQSDSTVGSRVQSFPSSELREILDKINSEDLASLIAEISESTVKQGLGNLPDSRLERIVKKGSNVPSAIESLPASQVPSAVASLPPPELGNFGAHLSTSTKIEIIREFTKPQEGKIVKEDTPSSVVGDAAMILTSDEIKKIEDDLMN